MKNFLKKSAAIFLTLVMLSGMFTCFAAYDFGGKDVSGYKSYVLLGDSIASGWSDVEDIESRFVRVEGSYGAYVADDLGVEEYHPMACIGFRTVEMRYILEEDFEPDRFLYYSIDKELMDTVHAPAMIEAITNADLITLNIGCNDWGSFLGWHVFEELDKAAEIGYWMHTEARRGCKPGVLEQEIVGRMEGVTYSKGWGPSFTTILSQNGETLHNHSHHQIITPGRLLVVDAGAESNTHYASDFTRTYPCSGKFTTKQREIYDIVQQANDYAYSLTKPGTTYWDVHYATARFLLEGLKALDLVRGDVDEMLPLGISGLFMPHGLGHNMGMDVHDMEDLGENYVGYAEDQKRHPLLGLGNLRMARRLEPGHVITDEPGLYFIPALIEQWKGEGTDKGFVNYEKLEGYYDFGGIRLEDDILVTADGARRLGPHRLPILSSDIEDLMSHE